MPNGTGSIERDEVGVELVDEQAPGVFRASEEDAAGRTRKLGQEALLRGDGRDEIDLAAPGLGCGLADCGDVLRLSVGATSQLFRPRDARQEEPVIGAEVDRPGLDWL